MRCETQHNDASQTTGFTVRQIFTNETKFHAYGHTKRAESVIGIQLEILKLCLLKA